MLNSDSSSGRNFILSPRTNSHIVLRIVASFGRRRAEEMRNAVNSIARLLNGNSLVELKLQRRRMVRVSARLSKAVKLKALNPDNIDVVAVKRSDWRETAELAGRRRGIKHGNIPIRCNLRRIGRRRCRRAHCRAFIVNVRVCGCYVHLEVGFKENHLNNDIAGKLRLHEKMPLEPK